jgi:RNA polymerase sigma-70 factor (ECF subfamily)
MLAVPIVHRLVTFSMQQARGESLMSAPGATTGEIALAAFHEGDKATLATCYRTHYARVFATVARLLPPVDAETVVHEVFYRLLADRAMRESFHGKNLGAWLSSVARNLAIDFARRRRWETDELGEALTAPQDHQLDDELEAKRLVERFRREVLPAEYAPVFEARFIKQLPQREAATSLSMPRTTLVYQEQKIRVLLQRFLLGKELG